MLAPVWKELDRFAELLSPTAWPDAAASFSPACAVQETDDAYQLSLDVPGVGPSDLDIELHGTRLLVTGERKGGDQRKGDAAGQRRYGKFQHVVALPEGVTADQVEARCKDGVLTLTVRKPATSRVTKIKIGGDAAAAAKPEQVARAN